MSLVAAEAGLGAFRPSSMRIAPRPEAKGEVDAAESAFEARRRALVSAGARAPLERVAALLISISRNNRHEGRDPRTIPDSLTCGFVADLLGFPIDTLASLLKALETRGLIAADPRAGLRLNDLDGLESLAGA
jgi:CRP/FNR family transcriptional regulator, anaerobic regulatory protein